MPGRPPDRAAVRRPLTLAEIVAWADAHHAVTGKWPTASSGLVQGAPSRTTWAAIDAALRLGHRGLPGRSSVAKLLAEHRQVRRPVAKPPISVEQIAVWADAHHAATGKWPRYDSGPVQAAPEPLTWRALDLALRVGLRGLPGESDLRTELAWQWWQLYRRARSRMSVPEILAWADAHHAATGAWPKWSSGRVRAARFPITWRAVDVALYEGNSVLPGGSRLSRLLAQERQVRGRVVKTPLTVAQIVAWAEAHYAATGQWPHSRSGPVLGTPRCGTWQAIETALKRGRRGLPGGSSLARLLRTARCRP
jgi:hypothetical protein